MQRIGCGGEGCFVERAGRIHLGLALETQCKIGEQHRIPCARKCQRTLIVILTDRRTIGLRQHHAQEVMRLGQIGCDAHGIARVALGFDEIASAEQQQCEFVGCPEVIRLEADEAADQGRARVGLSLRLADLVQDRKRARASRRELITHLARAETHNGEPTAAGAAQAAAAGAQPWIGDGGRLTHGGARRRRRPSPSHVAHRRAPLCVRAMPPLCRASPSRSRIPPPPDHPSPGETPATEVAHGDNTFAMACFMLSPTYCNLNPCRH